MKIAVTATEKSLDSDMDRRFGRCALFAVYDTASGDVTYIDNTQNLNAAQGAGIQAAQNIAKNGVEAVITGHCGPKAFKILCKAGITVYNVDANSVEKALELYNSNSLEASLQADVEGHWV